MAKVDNNWILIDATLPYRKWAGYNTPHIEYETYTTDEFEAKFKQEERYWANLALKWEEEKYAGLLYAPWIHEEVVINTDEVMETIFYLLMAWMIGTFMYIIYTIPLRKLFLQ